MWRTLTAMSEAKMDAKRASETAQRLALFVPLALVNSFAVFGQGAWAYDHLISTHLRVAHATVAFAVCALFAASLESIGVYLAVEAHAALVADQASGLLRAGSYAIGLLVGALNFWHFAGPGFAPTTAAVTFGLLSAISPWLWAIRSRAINRSRLRELGLLDERGVKLSTSRKFWHPVMSVKVIKWAAWAGVKDPAAAVAGWTAVTLAPPAATSKPRSAASDNVPASASPAPPAGPPAQKRPALPSRGRQGGTSDGMTKEAVRARYAAGEPIAKILLAWQGKKPVRRTLENWTDDLRDQHAAARAALPRTPSVAGGEA
jgi:hypothetical protein